MKKKLFIFSFIVSLNCAFAQFKDTFKNELTVSFNKRKFISTNSYYQSKGPFLNNSIYSSNISYNKQLKAFKRSKFFLLNGLTFKHYTIGYNESTNRLSNVRENIRINNFQIGLNCGFSFDKRVYKNKNSILYLCGGGFLYKSIYTPKFSKLYTYDVPLSSSTDSITVVINKNNYIYPYPFVQFKGKTKFGNNILLYGIKLNIGTDLSRKTFINYNIKSTDDGFYYQKNGTFTDARNQWEFFLGFTF